MLFMIQICSSYLFLASSRTCSAPSPQPAKDTVAWKLLWSRKAPAHKKPPHVLTILHKQLISPRADSIFSQCPRLHLHASQAESVELELAAQFSLLRLHPRVIFAKGTCLRASMQST